MIEQKRELINEIDNKVIKLLNERFSMTDQIGIYKREQKINVLDNKREEEIYNKIKELNLKNEKDIICIYEFIMMLSKKRQEEL